MRAARRIVAPAVAVLAVLAAGAASASESSIDCEGGIVSVGDTKLDLLGKCGPPTLRDVRDEERGGEVVVGKHRGIIAQTFRSSATVETWSYDFGPRRFTYTVTLEGGRVNRVERGSYGYGEWRGEPARLPIARCDSSALHEGDTKLDLLAKCGEPASSDRARVQRGGVFQQGNTTVYGTRLAEVEVWSYNFGPNRFMHLVRLEDGKVVQVERAGYGYRD